MAPTVEAQCEIEANTEVEFLKARLQGVLHFAALMQEQHDAIVATLKQLLAGDDRLQQKQEEILPRSVDTKVVLAELEQKEQGWQKLVEGLYSLQRGVAYDWTSQSIPRPLKVASAPTDTNSVIKPSWLWCPLRAFGSLRRQASDIATPSFQSMLWEIVSSMPDATVVMCDTPDLTVSLASKAAMSHWGASLVGRSVVSLMNGPDRAAWLRNELRKASNWSGFAIHNVGCDEFSNARGRSFDASVTVARLPAEVLSKKAAALLVVIETLELKDGFLPSFCHERSVSFMSDDPTVEPNDSISNIGIPDDLGRWAAPGVELREPLCWKRTVTH